ncbi:MAG: universal stress protein [Rhizobiales bacterium]|nr:universal stress protein [Hyphomicrobiales bacterium]
MSFKTIMVSLNDVTRAGEVTNVACQLATRHDAHLIGLFVIPVMPVYPAPGAYVLPELIENYEASFAERGEKAKSIFEKVTAGYELQIEWRLVHDGTSIVANGVIEHGHQADLVVIGQVDPDNYEGVELDFADRVVMETGRPVILVPMSGQFKTIGDRVVVGWNATSEAARAALDAAPLLAEASEVWLTWVDPQRTPDIAGQFPGSEMASTLARHGVKVATDPVPADGLSVGDVLLNRVSDHSADLLVVGAYGHSRMREFVFGGVTNTLLKHMTVPVLMSH